MSKENEYIFTCDQWMKVKHHACNRRASSCLQWDKRNSLLDLERLSQEVYGVAGEMGLSLMMDKSYDMKVFRCGQPDFSDFIHVRSIHTDANRLSICPEKDQPGVYVLMLVDSAVKPNQDRNNFIFDFEPPLLARVKGWVHILDVKRYCEREEDYGFTNRSNKKVCYISNDNLNLGFGAFLSYIKDRYKNVHYKPTHTRIYSDLDLETEVINLEIMLLERERLKKIRTPYPFIVS